MFIYQITFDNEFSCVSFFFFQAEDGIRDKLVTGVQTCALPIYCAAGNSSEVYGPTPSATAASRSAGVSTSRRRPGQSPDSGVAPERACAADEPGPNLGSRSRPHGAVSRTVPVPDASAT